MNSPDPVLAEEEAPPGFLSPEAANTLTHGVGFAFSMLGSALLVTFSALRGSAIHVVAGSVYGASLTLLYLCSTLYHWSSHPRVKRAFRIADHSAIYVLIAGTYTPYALCVLEGAWRWAVFGAAWGLALGGIGFKVFFTGRLKGLSTAIYLVMGWMALLLIRPLVREAGMGIAIWLLVGGLGYTLGAVFYMWKRLRHHHAIWHLFVMFASTVHFFTAMIYTIPWRD